MQCKRCKYELENKDPICPKCGYDNSKPKTKKQLNEIEKLKEINGKKVEKKREIPFWTYIFILAFITIIIIFTINLNENDKGKEYENTSTVSQENIKTFIYKDLYMDYSNVFTKGKNRIELKSNDNINISFELLTQDEYETYLNLNDCLDSKLNKIETKTFAGDNQYSHIFEHKSKYYKITVNYINNVNIYNKDLQTEIYKTLNTLR